MELKIFWTSFSQKEIEKIYTFYKGKLVSESQRNW